MLYPLSYEGGMPLTVRGRRRGFRGEGCLFSGG